MSSIKNLSALNPEPITVKGIKTYNPYLYRVYKNKSGDLYEFDAFEAKTTGTALGTIFKKHHQLNQDKKWMGKVGFPRGVIRDDPQKSLHRSEEEINLDTIFEKLAYDLFQELGRGLFEVPKTHLSHQPISNSFCKDDELVMGWNQMKIYESLRIMSFYMEGYRDFKEAQTIDNDQIVGFMEFVQIHNRPPEQILSPEPDQKLVPLEGMMALLAVGRCLTDTDLLGGKGENAGFKWIKNNKEEIVGAKVIKIDPGNAFKFANESEPGEACENWVLNTEHKLGKSNHLEDLRDLQTSTSNFETRILWKALTSNQQEEFIGTLLNTSRYLNSDEVLEFLFFRDGSFHYSDKASITKEIATKFQEQMKGWVRWQLEIYHDPLVEFLHSYPEQLLRIRYIDKFGELPLPMTDQTYPIRELFSDLVFVLPEEERKIKLGDFEVPLNSKESITLDQLFADEEKKVLLTGESGTGKSTICQKIAHDWASGRLFSEQFDVVFWIPLRNIHEQDLEIDIEETIISYISNHIFNKPEFLDLIQKAFSEKRILLILDGFDETEAAVKNALTPLLEDQKFHILLTARPDAQELPKWQRRIQNVGFSPKNIELYIKLFFENDYLPVLSKIKRDPNLFALANNPFHLQMLCHLWKNGKQIDSLTRLYQTMITELVKWEYKRRDKKFDTKKLLEVLEFISLLNFRDVGFLIDLFQPNLEERGLTEEDLIHSGLITKNPNGYYNFLHSSIREYLYASSISKLPKKDKYKIAFTLNQKEVLRFLCGILYQENPKQIPEFFQSFMDWNKELNLFFMDCLNECHDFYGDIPVLKELLELPPIRDAIIDYVGRNQLVHAIKWLHNKFPKILSSFKTQKKFNFFHLVALSGNLDLIEWISEQFPNLLKNANNHEITPQRIAAQEGYVELLEWFYNKDPSLIQKEDKSGLSLADSAAMNNQTEIMKQLKKYDSSFLKKIGKHGHILISAAALGKIKAMEWIYKQNPTLLQKTDLKGNNCLHYAAGNGKLKAVQWLYERDPSLLVQKNHRLETPFISAVSTGHIAVVEWIYEKDETSLENINTNGITPLHMAIIMEEIDSIEWLVNKDPSLLIKARKNGVGSPLFYAKLLRKKNISQYLENKIEEMEKELIIEPQLIQNAKELNTTPFYLASEQGRLSSVKWLYEKEQQKVIPMNLMEVRQNTWTSLHCAAKGGDTNVIAWLHKQDPSLLNKACNDLTPVHIAVICGRLEALKYMVTLDPYLLEKTQEDGSTLLHLAAYEGKTEIMDWLYFKDRSLLQKTSDLGLTPFHFSVLSGQMESMLWLHAKDPQLFRQKTADGWTILHSAVFGDYQSILEWIYEQDSDFIYKKTRDGNTPLHLAAFSKNINSVKWLCEKNPLLVLDEDIFGKTPLTFAQEAEEKDETIIQFLQEKTKEANMRLGEEYFQFAQVTKVAGEDWTSLHIAAYLGQVEKIDFLLEGDPDFLQKRTKEGHTALHIATKKGHIEAMKKLFEIDQTAAKETKTTNGESLFHIASENGKINAMEWLYDKDPSFLQTTTQNGWTPFHAAAVNDQTIAMEWLYEKAPFLIKETTQNGSTPLHSAASIGNTNAIEWLCKKEPSLIPMKTNENKTALNLAIINKHENAVALLKKARF